MRPWGFWKPVYEKVKAQDPQFERNRGFKRDMFNVFIGTIWQTGLVALPIYVVLMKTTPIIVCAAIIVLTLIILKKSRYDKLRD